jgi:hypothetical protein
MPRACIRGKGGYRWTSTGVFKDSYPWIQMMYASDYTSRRVFRRFLQLGIAVVMPQAWGGQHKPESGDSWYWSDGDTEGKGAYDPQHPAGELGKWPGPDAAFLRVMYAELRAQKYGPINAGRQALFGYSSGAFFVSRLVAAMPGLAGAPPVAAVECPHVIHHHLISCHLISCHLIPPSHVISSHVSSSHRHISSSGRSRGDPLRRLVRDVLSEWDVHAGPRPARRVWPGEQDVGGPGGSPEPLGLRTASSAPPYSPYGVF